MKRKALGKGLSSLLPQSAPVATAPRAVASPPGGLREIDIDRIRPNPRQPRDAFEAGALDELSSSLKKQGILQPVVVRPLPDGTFELVVGERRWRAAQQAGLLKVPAVVREISDDRLLETALIENIQRENLNAIEEARAYRALLEEGRLSQEQLASQVGKQRTTITNSLRLLGLPETVQEMIRAGRLSMGHGRALLALAAPADQERLAERAVRERLSVREVERLAAQAVRQPTGIGKVKTDRRDPNVVAAEESLQSAFGSKVRILQGRAGGRIELYFYSTGELERAYDLLLEMSRRRPKADNKVGTTKASRHSGRQQGPTQ